MFDTLMQMGRWVGYREGYQDLCRLYTSAALLDAFVEISIATQDGKVFAQGITRFNSAELDQIKGLGQDEILKIFPGRNRPEVVHRDHLAPIFAKSI